MLMQTKKHQLISHWAANRLVTDKWAAREDK